MDSEQINGLQVQEAIAWLQHLADIASAGAGPLSMPNGDPGEAQADAHGDAHGGMSDHMYRMLLEQLPVVTFMARLDGDLNEMYVSPQIEVMLGFSQEEWLGNPFLWYECLHPEDKQRWNVEFARFLMLDEPFRSVYRFIARDGHMVWVRGEVRMIRDDQGMPTYVQGIGYDITEREAAEERFRTLLEAAPDAMVIANEDGKIDLVNTQTERLFGYTRLEMLGQPVEMLIPERLRGHHPQHRSRFFSHPTMRPMGSALDLYALRKDGTEFPVEISLSPLKKEDGTFVFSTIRDITERKRTDQRILASLQEKEVLLKEIHHRVKNNLAVISSLLYLQSGYTSDGPTLNILQVSQDRVRSMALVHEMLYRSDDFASVDFGNYAVALAQQLFQTYSSPARKIELKIDVDPVRMNVDVAVPCGLILNELITNSLKHAFPAGQSGEIRLGLQRNDDGSCVLSVADNGIGVPKDLDIENSSSLGVRLIRSLTRQIDGRFELAPTNPGAKACLTVQINDDKENS
jgi:PAS domain S-box-containing protein